jgi:hypothetical protein
MISINSFFRFLLSLAVLSLWKTSSAQLLETKLGDSLDYAVYNSFSFYDTDDKYVYALRSDVRQPDAIHHIDAYDRNTLKLVSKIKIPLPADSKFYIKNLIKAESQYMLFYTYFDKTSSQVKVAEMNFDSTGNALTASLVLDSMPALNLVKDGNFDVYSRRKYNEYYVWSEREIYDKKKKLDSVEWKIKFYDYKNNLKRSMAYTINTGKKDGEAIQRTAIDSHNNFYIVSTVYEKGKDSQPMLKIFPGDSSAPIVSNLKFRQNDLTIGRQIYTYNDSSGHIIFYALTGTIDGLGLFPMGVYVLQVNEMTHNIEKEKTTRFKKFDPDGMSSYFLMGSMVREDHSMKIICEKRVRKVDSFYGAEVSSQYDIGNIYTCRLDSAYEVTETCIIQKHQKIDEGNSDYIGFYYLSTSDTCIFIYNDLPENLTALNTEGKVFRNGKISKGILTAAVANNSSVLYKQALFEKQDKNDIAAVKILESIHAGNHEEFLLIQKEGICRLLKISVK